MRDNPFRSSGPGSGPGKDPERLEKLFSLPVGLKVEKTGKREYVAHITAQYSGEVSWEQTEAYFADRKEENRIKENVCKMTELIWEAAQIPADKPFLPLSDRETSLVSLAALAIAMEQMDFFGCRVCELEEGFGTREGKMVPSEEIMEILGKSSLLVDFSSGDNENFTPGSAAFLAAYGKGCRTDGRKKDCRLGPGRFRRRKGKGNGQGSDPEGSK